VLNVTLDSARGLVNNFFVAYVPVTADDLEKFAELADSYAKMIREWKTAVAAALEAGLEPTFNGLKTLQGNLQREIDRAKQRIDGQAAVVGVKAERAKARALKAHAAKKKRA
jgi:hypothetical protein